MNKIYHDIMSGKKDSNIRFTDLQNELARHGFSCRVRGDHFIYKRADIAERINIQPNGNKAKSYQVKQIRNIFIKYEIKE